MKNYSKISKLGIITSSIAVIITTINLVHCVINGNSIYTSLVLFSSMMPILISNILIAENYKTKSEEEKNKN